MDLLFRNSRSAFLARGVAALVMAGLATVGLFAAPGPALAVDPNDAANQLMALTNITRTSNGLAALARDQRLSAVALDRSQDMITRNYFAHQIPPDNHTVVDIIESLGIRFRSAGENIEFNTALDFSTVQFAQTDFMNSPEHRENMLSPRWDRMGAGLFCAGNCAPGSRRMYAVEFMQSPAPETGGQAAQGGQPAPVQAPAELTRGERVKLPTVPTGLMENLISRLLRLFLGL